MTWSSCFRAVSAVQHCQERDTERSVQEHAVCDRLLDATGSIAVVLAAGNDAPQYSGTVMQTSNPGAPRTLKAASTICRERMLLLRAI